MSTDRQRDADLDRLLRAQLRREPAGPLGACPDAGMLAACIEGGVAGDERTALEAHLATCGRCQDVLAAMDLESPASPAAAPAPVAAARRPWLWRGHLHWLIPVGAATALVVYVASKPAIAPYFPPTGPGPDTQMSELRPTAQTPGVSGFASRPDERPAPASQATPAPARAAQASEAAPPKQATPPAAEGRSERERAVAAAPPFAPVVPPTPSKDERAAAPANTAERLALDVDASKRAAAPAAPVPQAARVAPAPVAPAKPAVVVAEAAPQAGAGVAQSIAATQTAAKGTAADAAAPVQLKSASAERVLHTAASDLIEVSAPGGQVQWRVGSEGAIWRSADEGRSWYPQKSGVKAALLAATAPSISTCWAVGAGGTVLLTDDGERWERRPFPEKTDLVAVDARSAHDATVTTRDGRRFTTADRGATWTPHQ